MDVEAIERLLKVPEAVIAREVSSLESRIWIPDTELAFRMCNIVSEKGENDLIVGFRDDQGFYEKKTIKRSECQTTSITHFCDDICDLSELNDASVLHTLQSRYQNGLIHTYSGLFCVVVNPWKHVPVYSREMMRYFKEQSRVQQILPPHIYSVAQIAYDGILNGGNHQSILITGESGAGKTENTKKIIEYLIWSAEHASDGSPDQQLHLELVSAGIALEAFTNARTVHNSNSSRVGKFIRIDFDQAGKLQAAQIECYLLEKSRVVNQNEGDRNFHIFYQMFSSAFPNDLREAFGLRADASSYKILNQGGNTADPSINDHEHGIETQEALNRLGFSEREKRSIWETAAICILMGEVKFCERQGLDISYIDGEKEISAVCNLLQVKSGKLVDALTQPCIRVGDKVIRKSQNLKKTSFSVAALIKILYDRMFKWIVLRCNEAIDKRDKMSESFKNTYIGVLDMAGFEIMKTNSFEQFCINYTNEKLQQFFNHFLFVREQTEYMEEQLEWSPIDYTDELQITIDMIEKPIGLIALLQEECLVPNGSDSALLEKLIQNLSSSYVFAKSKQSSRNTSVTHFTVTHYAGSIPYNIDGWVEKNRDSVEQNILDVLSQSENVFIRDLFPPVVAQDTMIRSRRGNLSASTVSYIYKEQLNNLLQTLQSTSAHFVRCIVPNHNRQPNLIQGPLVLHQLRCNGVLEGVRICRKGYPNRITFMEFFARYKMLAGPHFRASSRNEKEMLSELCEAAEIPSDRYQLGLTKVFCRAGLLSELEERRRALITCMVSGIQAHIRWYWEQQRLKRKYDEWNAICTIQSNVRIYSRVATWDWYRLYARIRSLIPLERDKQKIVELSKENETLYEKCSIMMDEIENTREAVQQAERDARKIHEERQEMEKRLAETSKELSANEDVLNMMEKRFEEQHQKVMKLHTCVRDNEKTLQRVENEKDELAQQLFKTREKLDRETALKVHLEEENEQYQEQMQEMETNMDVMRQNTENWRIKIEKFEDEANQFEERRNRQSDLVSELQQTIDELNARASELDANLRNERNLRRKLETENDSLLEDLHRLNQRLDETQKNLDLMKDNNRKKDTAIRSLEKAVQEKAEQMNTCIAELKKIHRASQADMQGANDDLRKKCQKLESDNRQLKHRLDSAVFERESSVESDYGRGSRLSLSRQYSMSSTSSLNSVRTIGRRRETEPDVFRASRSPLSWSRRDTEPDIRTMSLSWKKENDDLRPDWTPLSKSPSQMQIMDRERQIAQLERSTQSLNTDNQLLRREIEVYKQSLSEAEREKETLNRQNKTLSYELDKSEKHLTKEENAIQLLQQKLKKAQSNVDTWKQKFEESLTESKNDIIFERKKMKERMEKLMHEHELRSSHYASVDKTRDKLQSELTETQVNLDRALVQIAHMENLSRSQMSIAESWESQNKASVTEIDDLRKENATLKVQVRRQGRQIELLTQQSEIDDYVTKLETKVDQFQEKITDTTIQP